MMIFIASPFETEASPLKSLLSLMSKTLALIR